jgi:hypothetical protein
MLKQARDSCLPSGFCGVRLGLTMTFATDFALLLIMVIGLLRLRLEAGEMLGMGRLLWEQIRWLFISRKLFLLMRFPSVSIMTDSGIIWLLIATIIEGPRNCVSDYFSCASPFTHQPSQVFFSLGLNGNVLVLSPGLVY